MLAHHRVDQDEEEAEQEAVEATYCRGALKVGLRFRPEKCLGSSKESADRDRRS
jgi:hypothetical protein